MQSLHRGEHVAGLLANPGGEGASIQPSDIEAAQLGSRSLEIDRLRKWDKADVVSVYVADKWLCRMRIALLDVPGELGVER